MQGFQRFSGLLRDARIQVIVSFVFLFLVGIPVWWTLTDVSRAALPNEEIHRLYASESFRYNWKLSLEVIAVSADSSVAASVNRIASATSKLLSSPVSSSALHYRPEVSVSSSVAIPPTAPRPQQDIDDWISLKLLNGTRGVNGRYRVFLLYDHEAAADTHGHDVWFGKYRHGWLVVSGRPQPEKVAESIAEAVELRILGGAATQFVAAKHAPEYRVSFTLLNADPTALYATWDFAAAAALYLKPFFDALSVFADFRVDSQVINFGALMREPVRNKTDGTYSIPMASVAKYINPSEWKLDFVGSTTQPLLNFIVFIPNASHTPLHLRLSNGEKSPTNAFVIPQYGGVLLWNPPPSPPVANASSSEQDQQQQQRGRRRLQLGAGDVLPFARVFLAQLRELLGVASIQDAAVVPATSTGIAEWELDALVRRYVSHNVNSTAASLQSLSQLVLQLPNMVVHENIADLCRVALDAVARAHRAVADGDLDAAAAASKQAVVAAEEAFFDPHMLALLYFPDEHKYAVYALPFFPVVFQLLSGIRGEFKARKQKKVKTA